MKKMLTIITTLVCLIGFASIAGATTCGEGKLVPEGTLVSAVCYSDSTADVFITGVTVGELMQYAFEDPKPIEAKNGVYRIKLWESRRFNFTYSHPECSKDPYSLITPEMAGGHGHIGEGIGIDCSNPKGCAYVITCE